MKIEVFSDITKDSDGTETWRHIENATKDLNPFQRLDWARSWLASYNDVTRTYILVARNDREAMALPMMEHKGVLRSLCYNAADFTGTIYTGNGHSTSKCIANYLANTTAHNKKLLWNVLPDDPIVKTLKNHGKLALVESVTGHSLDIAGIRSDPARWLRSSATRKQAHRDLRRLIRDGAHLRHRVSPKEVDLEVLMDIHDREWHAKGSSGKFADQRRRMFLKKLATDDFPMLVSAMSLENKVLAYNIHFYSDTTMSLWNSGYNIDYSQRGPGSALLVADIMYLAMETTYASFDLLRGDEKYKHAYANRSYEVHTYEIP